MTALALSVFAASLVGSVHCAGMCGGFVCFYAGTDGRAGMTSHAAYNAGRLVSYLLLGLAAGLVGSAVAQTGDVLGIERLAAIVAGTLMIVWGIAMVLEQAGVRLPLPSLASPAQGWIAQRVQSLRTLPPPQRALATGVLTTLLPCGWLYTFVVSAAGTGSVWRAEGLMLVFWLGTLPMMVTLGAAVRQVAGPLRRRVPLISAAAIVVVGIVSLTSHLRVDEHAAHGPAVAAPTYATPAALPNGHDTH